MDTVEIAQTIAIIGLLILAFFEFRRTRISREIDAYNTIIRMMNDLRRHRIEDPKMERVLFKTRKYWGDAQIKRHVYAVGLANIFEWMLLSRKAGLIDRRIWEEWIDLWKTVILKDESMAAKLKDRVVYTFSRVEAWEMVKKMSEDEQFRPSDPHEGFFRKSFKRLDSLRGTFRRQGQKDSRPML